MFAKSFVAAHQQVGAFTATNVNGNIVKQGGNVASYFCTPGGRVIHAVIGPVNADELLTEANWALSVWNQAKQLSIESKRRQVSLAHLGELPEPLRALQSRFTAVNRSAGTSWAGYSRVGSQRSQMVHQLLAAKPLAPLEDIYTYVFEQILGERVSNSPNVELAEQGLQFAQRENRPLLFILHDAKENSLFMEQWLAWLKSKQYGNPNLLALLRQCVVIALPQKEMPALSSRLKQEPFTAATLGSPLFVITDSRGKQLDSRTGLQSVDQLNLPLAKAIMAEIKLAPPPNVARLKNLAVVIKRIDSGLAAELQAVIEEVAANHKSAHNTKFDTAGQKTKDTSG